MLKRSSIPFAFRFLPFVLLLLVMVLPVFGATYSDADFVGRGYGRFAAYNYELKPEMENLVNYGLDRLIKEHTRVFGRGVRQGFTVRYRIFGQFDDYAAYSLARYKKEVTKNLLGYYSPRTREIVTWRQQQTWLLVPTLLHEGTHAIMDEMFGAMPFWMVEGSADWFGEPAWAEGTTLKKDKQARWVRLNKMREEGKLPTLAKYLPSSDYDAWAKMFDGNVSQGYDLGFSLFDFFMSNPQATKFMAGIVTGRNTEQSDDPSLTFAKYSHAQWPGGLPMFEKGWHSWIKLKAEGKAPPTAPLTPAKTAPKR